MVKNRRQTDWLKTTALLLSVVLGLTGIGRLVFNSGRDAEKFDALAAGVIVLRGEVGAMRSDLQTHTNQLEMARFDRERVEAALKAYNEKNDRRAAEILRRLNIIDPHGGGFMGGGR